MAVVFQGRGARQGRVYGFGGWGRGLGDAASDAILSSSWGSAAYAAWQSAVAALPAGYTMGDPTSPLWGAAYYNGVKLMSAPDDPAVMAKIQAAADAAYRLYNPIDAIRSSTNPYMQAVLLDPEWIELEGSGQPIVFSSLSSGLQAKIRLVDNLYKSLTGQALSAPLITSGPTVDTGPARYLQGGIEFLADGTVISYNGTPAPSGTMLSPAEVESLLNTGQLPAGDSGPFVKNAPAPVVSDAPPAPSSSTVQTGQAAPAPVPYSYTPGPSASPARPSPYTPALVDSYSAINSSAGGGGSFQSTGSSASGAVAPSSGFTLSRSLILAGAMGALAFVFSRSTPSRRRRRRPRR